MMDGDKWKISTDYGQVSFKLWVVPEIKDEKAVINYLNNNDLREFLKIELKTWDFKKLVASQIENVIPWINIVEKSNLTISAVW